jgi:hypothetical protein
MTCARLGCAKADLNLGLSLVIVCGSAGDYVVEVGKVLVERLPPLLKVMGTIWLAVLGDQCLVLVQGSLVMLGMEVMEVSSYNV